MLLFVLLLLLNYCKSCNLYGFGKKKNVLIVLKAAQVLNLKTPNRINKQFFRVFSPIFSWFRLLFAIVSHPLHSTSAAAVCGNGNAKLTESAASFWFAFFVFLHTDVSIHLFLYCGYAISQPPLPPIIHITTIHLFCL